MILEPWEHLKLSRESLQKGKMRLRPGTEPTFRSWMEEEGPGSGRKIQRGFHRNQEKGSFMEAVVSGIDVNEGSREARLKIAGVTTSAC